MEDFNGKINYKWRIFEDPHHRSMAGAPRCGERNRPRKQEAAAHGGVRRRGQRVRWDHGTLGWGMDGKVVEVYIYYICVYRMVDNI